MPTETIAGTSVQVDDEGFFTDHLAWSEGMAPTLAAEAGIDELTEDHWTVVKFMRVDFEEKGESPTLRRVSAQTGITTKRLFELFPKKPAKKMAYVAGVPKPKGCV